MIHHIWLTNCYSIRFPSQTVLFWELKEAKRALRKWLKSKTK